MVFTNPAGNVRSNANFLNNGGLRAGCWCIHRYLSMLMFVPVTSSTVLDKSFHECVFWGWLVQSGWCLIKGRLRLLYPEHLHGNPVTDHDGPQMNNCNIPFYIVFYWNLRFFWICQFQASTSPRGPPGDLLILVAPGVGPFTHLFCSGVHPGVGY